MHCLGYNTRRRFEARQSVDLHRHNRLHGTPRLLAMRRFQISALLARIVHSASAGLLVGLVFPTDHATSMPVRASLC